MPNRRNLASLALRSAVIALAAAAVWLPVSPQIVERAYSQGPYAVAQPWVTGASNLIPIACIDVLVIVVGVAWLALAVRDVRRRHSWLGAAAAVGARTLVWLAGSYLIFLAAWGLNYRRVPLAEKLDFESSRVSPEAAHDLAMIAVGQVNALYGPARPTLPGFGATSAASGIDPALADAFARTQRDLGVARLAAPARPKHSLADWYFQRVGVSGMTDPIFLETLVAGDLLPIEQPFVVAHEWSHLAGINDEGEANFVGWLVCLRGTPAHQYSGWLFLVGELARALGAADRAAMGEALGPGPRADLRAIADRIQQHVSPRVSAAGWRVYNQYLKANRVESGTASYAEVVKLVLGVRFSGEWVPQKRSN